MLDQIRILLKSNSELSGTDIFYEDSPQGTKMPYIILSSIDGDVNDSKDAPSEVDQLNVQVTAYAEHLYTHGSKMGAYSLIRQVREALDHTEAAGLYARAQDTPSTMNISIPNHPMFAVEQNYEVYLTI